MLNKIKLRIKEYESQLSIQKRLSISNILMIIVPLLLSSLILIVLVKIGYSVIVQLFIPDLIGGHFAEEQHYTQTLHMFQSTGVVIVIIVAFVVILTVFITNKFLTKFVYQRIREPLDKISECVEKIKDGNLETLIFHEYDDEFKPVCESINIMQERLRLSAENTAKQSQSHKELFVGISHDLRSPLTSLRAYTEALLDGIVIDPENQRKYLLKIHEKELDIERMVEQLFLISKMELNDFPVQMQNFQLESFIHKVVDENPFDDLYTSIDIDKKLVIRADKNLLQRIVVNILENSNKYKNKETVIVRIQAKAENGRIQIVFADNGPGVPEDQLPKLFKTFYRTDPARKKPSCGSGLGLAIIKRATDRMGGFVLAKNLPKEGLAILIELEVGNDE